MIEYLRTLASVWLMKLSQKVRPKYDGTVIKFILNKDKTYTVLFNGVKYDLEDILNIVLMGISSKQLKHPMLDNTNTIINNNESFNRTNVKYEQTQTLDAHHLPALFDKDATNEQDINDLYRMLVLAEPVTIYDLMTVWADCEAELMPFQHVSRASAFFALLNYISHPAKTPKYPNDMPAPPPNAFMPV